MKLDAHLKLAREWDITLSKIDAEEDHIAAIEICMMMVTTLMNAVFHKRGIQAEQFDQNHTFRPPLSEEVEARITPDVRTMMDDMNYIERMRNLHCRAITGDPTAPRVLPPWEPEVSVKCIENLRKIQAFSDQVMAE
ncbi:MAG: hypothetical protein O2912_09435 [Proteobacteria bacterium]|nr:hypothetical protein [Pseudomonadota bacterium]